MPIEEDIDLHRLIWSPDDLELDGTVKTSAFRKGDLRGGDSFVSVSRVDELVPSAEVATAQKQANNADGVQFVRAAAWSALLNCLSVQRALDHDGIAPFKVTSEPIKDENDAHCGIRNVSGNVGKSYINQLRVMLVRLVHNAERLDDFLDRF